MVILQFNKLIRNKWVWGVFAVAVSAAFCFDDLFTTRDRGEQGSGDAGTLAGESIDMKRFRVIADEVRGIGSNKDWKMKQGDVNRIAWENYAALKVATENGIEAPDTEVQAMIRQDPSFQQNGAFDFNQYVRVLASVSLTPEEFEASFKRRLTLARLGQGALAAATWSSPMELEQAVSDMTDELTVRVASFSQTAKEADAVKVDDAAIRKWYDANTKALELPERVKIRFVKFDATDAKILTKMKVTEDEMRDHYDVTVDKYTTTDTNGVEKVKKFEDVKGAIEAELKQMAAVEFYETNLLSRAYAVRAAKGKSRLDEIAAEEGGRKVEVSDWFAVEGGYQEGFMKYIGSIAPGAKGFAEAVAGLDPETEDLRYAVVSSDKAVWLIEKAETSPKHTPTFEEAKKAIRPRVIRDAKADAFKASVEAIAKGGAKAVLATKQVSTNYVFTANKMRSGESDIPNAMAVARAAMKLQKGEVSEFTLTGTGKAILVVCIDRKVGDAAEAMVLRSGIRDDLAMLQLRQIPEAWKKWNLKRLGFEPGSDTSIENPEEEE